MAVSSALTIQVMRQGRFGHKGGDASVTLQSTHFSVGNMESKIDFPTGTGEPFVQSLWKPLKTVLYPCPAHDVDVIFELGDVMTVRISRAGTLMRG